MKTLFIFIVLFLSFPANADYLPIGSFWGIADGALTTTRVDGIVAMEDRDGNRFELPKIYKNVSEFKNGICTLVVRTNESGGNVLGMIANKVSQKAFYLKNENGKLEIADIDFIKFHCKEI